MKTTRNAIQSAGKCLFLAFIIIFTPSAGFANIYYKRTLDDCYAYIIRNYAERKMVVWASSMKRYCKCALNGTILDDCPKMKALTEEEFENELRAGQSNNSGSGSNVHFHIPITPTPTYFLLP